MAQGDPSRGAMSDRTEINAMPGQASCLGCGYFLCRLPEPVCPECGRAFDPTNPRTYNPDPPATRRRRRIKRAVVATAILLLLIGLSPRGLLRGSITFTDIDSGAQAIVCRHELVSPSWMPIRYPGIHWTSGSLEQTESQSASPNQRGIAVSVAADLGIGGNCGGTISYRPGQVAKVNHLETTPATAATVLKQLMSPSSNGITLYSEPRR